MRFLGGGGSAWQADGSLLTLTWPGKRGVGGKRREEGKARCQAGLLRGRVNLTSPRPSLLQVCREYFSTYGSPPSPISTS